MAVSHQHTLQEIQWLSDRVSTQVRTIALGILAVAWALLITPAKMPGISGKGLLLVCLLAILVVVVDLAQYVAGYLNTLRLHRRLLREGIEDYYDRGAPFYQVRVGLFWAKQILAFVAFFALVLVVHPGLLGQF